MKISFYVRVDAEIPDGTDIDGLVISNEPSDFRMLCKDGCPIEDYRVENVQTLETWEYS